MYQYNVKALTNYFILYHGDEIVLVITIRKLINCPTDASISNHDKYIVLLQ